MIKLIGCGEHPALIGKSTSFTYNQLIDSIEQFADTLKLCSGDRMVIFSDNRPEWIIALYAAWLKGGIAVPADASLTREDLAYIILDSRPAVICCSAEKTALVQEILQEEKIRSRIVILDETMPAAERISDRQDLVIADVKETALILYTSGTTGNPKGVMLSFRNMEANLVAVCHQVRVFIPTDRIMILLPLHHILPLLGSVVAPLYVGATMVLNTSLAAEDILATLKNYKVTMMIGVPRLYQLIYKGMREKIRQNPVARIMLRMAGAMQSLKFSRFLFASVQRKFGGNIRYLVSGGAPIEPEVVSFFLTLGFELLEGYGMTETAPMITFTRPGKILPGVPGQLLPGMLVRFDQDEIMVKGDNVMQGYYHKPRETAEVMEDGWLHTGDLGYMDEQGYLHVTGRKKEILVLPNGKNINPEEVEHAIYRQSAFVKEAGVFMKDGILQALIIPDFKKLNEAGVTDIESFIRWEVIQKMNQSVPPYRKVLRFSINTGELPKTRLGKIRRYLLPELAVARQQVQQDEPQTREYQSIKKFLEAETQQTVHPGDHLELDLALDSLARVSLSAFIDTAFGVDIPENSFSEFASVEKLADYLHQKKTRFSFEGISWSHILKEKIHLTLPNSGFTHNLLKNMFQVIFRMFMRIRARGMEKLPENACIIAPNHQSILDGFLVASLFKRRFIKKTYVYAKEKHFRGAFLRFLASRNNIILVDVNKDLKLSIQKLAEVLKKGKNLLIFPEGTRTLTGKLGEFKQTFAILSQEMRVPIVPVVIKGSFDILPAGSRFPRLFRRVSVEFLDPVYPDNHTYESLKNLIYQQLANKLKD